MNACVRFFIGGRVQGVGYRYSALQEARRLQLTGWVRNLDDGRVELFACGTEVALMELERWLWQGPAGANVTAVTRNSEPRESFNGFDIR